MNCQKSVLAKTTLAPSKALSREVGSSRSAAMSSIPRSRRDALEGLSGLRVMPRTRQPGLDAKRRATEPPCRPVAPMTTISLVDIVELDEDEVVCETESQNTSWCNATAGFLGSVVYMLYHGAIPVDSACAHALGGTRRIGNPHASCDTLCNPPLAESDRCSPAARHGETCRQHETSLFDLDVFTYMTRRLCHPSGQKVA